MESFKYYRATLNIYYKKLGGVRIFQNKKLHNLLTQIFSKRPAQPKYLFAWDVSTVVNIMRSIEE